MKSSLATTCLLIVTVLFGFSVQSVRADITDEMLNPFIARLAEVKKASYLYERVKIGLAAAFLPVEKMKVVDLMSHDVLAAVATLGKGSLLEDIKSLLRQVGLPSDLTFREQILYVNDPAHPVFHPLKAVGPKLAISWPSW